MCGRYIPNTEEEIMEIREILTEISIRISVEEYDNQDVYPSKKAPVLYLDKQEGIIENASFGFKKWDNEKQRIFNAKSEGVASSRLFAPLIRDKRCIVPAKGYYEWKNLDNNVKEKYTFYNNQSNIIYMLGLYKSEEKEFVILTKEADENINDIHHRMPLIIKEEYLEEWLKGKLDINNLSMTLQEVDYHKV